MQKSQFIKKRHSFPSSDRSLLRCNDSSGKDFDKETDISDTIIINNNKTVETKKKRCYEMMMITPLTLETEQHILAGSPVVDIDVKDVTVKDYDDGFDPGGFDANFD